MMSRNTDPRPPYLGNNPKIKKNKKIYCFPYPAHAKRARAINDRQSPTVVKIFRGKNRTPALKWLLLGKRKEIFIIYIYKINKIYIFAKSWIFRLLYRIHVVY